jgi:hypothetical protein
VSPLSVSDAPFTFENTGSLHTARESHTATLLANGKVLVAGGEGGSGSLTSTELYDPASGSWPDPTPNPLTIGRAFHTATLLPNGKVLVAGGFNSGHLSSAELYDPASGTWAMTGHLNTARAYHTATLLANGKVLVAGGEGDTGALTSAELYDPASGSWAMTGDLIIGRADHTATLLLPTARCWWQGERIPWAILGPARNCTTRSAGAGL